MKLRTKKSHISCSSGNFNPIGYEILVYFDDGEVVTDFIQNYEIEINEAWKPLEEAFFDRDVIPDNRNLRFGPPATEKDRERGYSL